MPWRPMTEALSSAAQALLALEQRHAAHNYHPLPVVLTRGEGAHVYEVPVQRGGGCHLRADEVGASAAALPALEVPVRRGGAALAG